MEQQTEQKKNVVDRAALLEIAKQASSIQEFLVDASIGISADRRLIIDFVLDNYDTKIDAQTRVEEAFDFAFERIITSLRSICYRKTGNSDLGDQLEGHLRLELKEDLEKVYDKSTD